MTFEMAMNGTFPRWLVCKKANAFFVFGVGLVMTFGRGETAVCHYQFISNPAIVRRIFASLFKEET